MGQRLTAAQCRAARGLLDWTQEELAHKAGVSRSTVRDFEKGRHDLQPVSEELILRALDGAGVLVLPRDRLGAGVRFSGPGRG